MCHEGLSGIFLDAKSELQPTVPSLSLEVTVFLDAVDEVSYV